MTLAEVGSAIEVFLKEFESDIRVNKPNKLGLSAYCDTRVWVDGRYLRIRYVPYRTASCLTNSEARRYLLWLVFGNVGKHWSCKSWNKRRADD